MYVTQRSATHDVGPRLPQSRQHETRARSSGEQANAAATPILRCAAAPHGKALLGTPPRLPSTATHPGCLPIGTHDCGTAGCATTTQQPVSRRSRAGNWDLAALNIPAIGPAARLLETLVL